MTSDAHFDVSRRGSYQSADSHYDRDLKRRRMSVDEVYLSPSETPSPPTTEALARTHPFSPPPLPQPSYLSSASTTSSYSSASMLYSLPPPASPPAYSPQAAPQHHHYGYEAVKVEEDTYLSPTQESSQQHLSYPALHSFHAPPELGSWHTYSADRTQIQH
ncbi:hypothetical protein BV25DRAFT_1908054 [Artomyces pyxidatus]|uniref:Uncharacterized protein n=1 Tax=Artomyces pyxidatus TaxID=48021 RepID=A0ACB8SX63_9AGAM|nr:hypothetical protein BV25DRAFT_1908054 [Artomyces pyxidatus]